MHEKYEFQNSLIEPAPAHPKTNEYKQISRILDRNPIIYDLALKDLTKGVKKAGAGAKGMTAEQVVRAAIIKHAEGFSYEDLAFHLVDSVTFREFCKIGFGMKAFKKSALQRNIKALSPDIWEEINKAVLGYAQKEKIENGGKVRIDCTVVDSDIHDPTDSELLWDVVRVLTRILQDAKSKIERLKFSDRDHTKRAKRRAMGVLNAKDKKGRKEAYKDLLKVSDKAIGYALSAIGELKEFSSADIKQMALAAGFASELEHYLPLARQVVNQTKRRVLHGETVPASEKIVSIFEEHTDIIRKDNRETLYGHKICLTGGASNLILDCVILDGNPADSTLTDKMFDRHESNFGSYPLKAALDGGFASKVNLESAKGKGIKDICFSKRKGMEKEDMCRSINVYKGLRNFRAGIEAGISWLKRCFGLGRSAWKGLSSFKSYVWSAIVSANLLTIARKQLA